LSKKKLYAVIGTAVLVVLALGAGLFINWINQPSEQTIVVQNADVTTQPTTQTVDTPYFTFVLPASYAVRNNKSVDPHMVHILAFTTLNVDSQVGVSSALLPSDGLKGVGDYNLRATATDQYEQFVDSSFPPGSVSFRLVSSAVNPIVFMVNGDRYASVSVSGSASNSDQLTLLKAITSSWLWK